MIPSVPVSALKNAPTERVFWLQAKTILSINPNLIVEVRINAWQVAFRTPRFMEKLDRIQKGLAKLRRDGHKQLIPDYLDRALDPDEPKPCAWQYLKAISATGC
ncbi:MAG: hypothetical protein AAB669_00785 [Patescibacteria group bacterium]